MMQKDVVAQRKQVLVFALPTLHLLCDNEGLDTGRELRTTGEKLGDLHINCDFLGGHYQNSTDYLIM